MQGKADFCEQKEAGFIFGADHLCFWNPRSFKKRLIPLILISKSGNKRHSNIFVTFNWKEKNCLHTAKSPSKIVGRQELDEIFSHISNAYETKKNQHHFQRVKWRRHIKRLLEIDIKKYILKIPQST